MRLLQHLRRSKHVLAREARRASVGLRSCLTLLGLAALALASAGCSLVDSQLPHRGYAVNVGSSTLREDLLLLNIVRASRFEPMTFVNLSKYNASGTLEAGIQGSRNFGLMYDILNRGPIAVGTQATSAVVKGVATPSLRTNTAANFDIAPLENKEFYAGLLGQIDLATINIFVNAGLSRELVLHALVKTARIEHSDGTLYQFHNDPANDAFDGDNSASGQRRCEALLDTGDLQPAFVHPIWRRPAECNYQKFLFFLRAAVMYGMTTEVVERRAAEGRSGKVAGKGDGGRQGTEVVICFDPAIAIEYGREVSAEGRCGGARRRLSDPRRYGELGPHIRQIQPVLRSPYSVFQYFGRLLATNNAHRVRLIDAGTPRLPTGDRSILTVTSGPTLEGCFASAMHDGEAFCVPGKGANNTKEMFVLLNALVALSTTRSALPVTQTVQIAP